MHSMYSPAPADWVNWSLMDSNFLRVSSTFLSIMTDFKNVLVWMVLIRPLISNSSSPLSKHLKIVPRLPNTIGITVILIFQRFLSSLRQDQSTYLSLPSLSFSLSGRMKRQNALYGKFSSLFFVVDDHELWSSGRDYLICLQHKIL